MFTRPRGLRKDSLSADETEYARSASASVMFLALADVAVDTTPFTEAGDADDAAAFVRTRSAHDLGGAFGAGVDTGACVVSSDDASAVIVSELAAVSEAGGEKAELGGSGCAFICACGDCTGALRCAGIGALGIAGTTGRVGVLIWAVPDGTEADVEDGVTGASSASDGAWEVAGVSRSEGAATVDVCDSDCSSVVSPASITESASSVTGSELLDGSSKPGADNGTCWVFRLLFRSAAGNASSGLESHGS